MSKTRYTDSHEHPLSWFKPVYEDIPVAQDNYTSELNKGLYTFIQGIEIKSGYQKIKYIYYAPTGKILAVESVPVLYDGAKGDKGENGAQGSAYKNIGHDDIGTGIRTPWADGDTYLNAVDGYLYTYDAATRHWNKIPSYADSRYNQAINDMIALSNNTDYDAEFFEVVNLWVKNLFAEEIIVGNEIKSKNFETGKTGFSLTEDGTANFNEIKINDAKIQSLSNNLAIGYNAVNDAVTGGWNVGIGSGALRNITSGVSNVAIGSGAQSLKTAGNTVSIGTMCNSALVSGHANIGIGVYCMAENVTGTSNICIGAYSGFTTNSSSSAYNPSNTRGIVNGNYNVAMGHGSLAYALSESQANDIYRDDSLHSNVTGNRNLALGAYAFAPVGNWDYQININNSIIYVEFNSACTQRKFKHVIDLYFPWSGYDNDSTGAMGQIDHEAITAIGHPANVNGSQVSLYGLGGAVKFTANGLSDATLGHKIQIAFVAPVDNSKILNK